MSEVEARPAPTRGRSSARSGRGGFGRGGPRASRKPVNGTSTEHAQMQKLFEDQGEVGEMKKRYASELGMLKDMFADWTDVDLVFALQETDGDVASTVDKITHGNVSQFAEVKKSKDRARSKVKDEPATAGVADKPTARGGRGRGGLESARGGRGRGFDRSRGGVRGSRAGPATTNGIEKDAGTTSVPTIESSAWDTTTSTEPATGGLASTAAETAKEATTSPGKSSWGTVGIAEATPAAAFEGENSSLRPEGRAKKSWASIFSRPIFARAPVALQQAPAPSQPHPTELVASGEVPLAKDESVEAEVQLEPVPPAPTIQESVAETVHELSPLAAPPSIGEEGQDLTITPSKDPLTEENVEHLPDESHAPATQTVASTAGSVDTRNLTPLPNQQAPIGSRPPMGGYAATAYRATGLPGRSASFQRRVLEQQEAVVMPGHNALDRAAVQFGSMGLNGEPGLDVDEEREEPETQQALQHSPPAQPRTSLPPVPQQPQEAANHQGLPTPKQAPGLPPASLQNQHQVQDATMTPALSQDQAQMDPQYNQYGQYGRPAMQQDSGAPQQQKAYDPFGHQAQPGRYDQYGTQQTPQQAQPQPQQQQHSYAGFGALSSAPNDYSQYYTSNEQQHNAYNQYYGGNYGAQDARNNVGGFQQDAGMAQQRSVSGFGAGTNESAFSQQVQQQVSIPPSPLQQHQQMQPVSFQSNGNYNSNHRLQTELHRQHTFTRDLPEPITQSTKRIPAIHPDLLSEAGEKPRNFDTPLSEPLPQRGPKLAPLRDLSNRGDSSAAQQSRFHEAPGAGQVTPNSLMGGQQQRSAPSAQQSQQHSMHQAPGGQQHQSSSYSANAGYPYGHPYYQSPYQQAYQNQFGYSQGIGGYGGGQGGYPGKQQGGMYGGPGGYGSMGSHSSFDQHSSSPANAGAFGQNQQSSMRSASGMSGLGAGLDDYGRSAVQSSAHQSSAFGGMNDPFARSASGFGGQGGYGQQSLGGPEDSLKPYADSKHGPSPALGQPGRPGSTANSAAGPTQAGLPPPQSHQSSFGYAGFPGQNSQDGGLGGLGSHQQGMGGQGGYGSYGASGFGQTYGGYGSRGGWGSQYGAH